MRNKSYLEGYRGEVIRNILESGFMARDIIKLYEGPYAEQMRRTISRLKKEGVVEEKKTISGIKYLTLTKAGKELVLGEANAELIEAYSSPRVKEAIRYLDMQKPPRKTDDNLEFAYQTNQNKLVNDATSKVFMKMAGLKPASDSDIANGDIKREEALFIDSKRTKQLGSFKAAISSQKSSQKLANSRINGICVTEGGIYGVYFTGDAAPEWAQLGEKRMVACIKAIASRNIAGYSMGFYEGECIVITKIDSNFPEMILREYKDKTSRRMLMNIDSTYDHMYSIQYSPEGIRMLRIMQVENWQAKIKLEMFYEKEIEESNFVSTACDAYDRRNGIYKLAFCIPDMTKLKSFAQRAKLADEPDKYHVYCYKNQEHILKPVLKDYVKYHLIPLDEVEKRLDILDM